MSYSPLRGNWEKVDEMCFRDDVQIYQIPEEVDIFDPIYMDYSPENPTPTEFFQNGDSEWKIESCKANTIREALKGEGYTDHRNVSDEQLVSMKSKGKSYSDIAKQTGIKEGTVKSRVHRHRSKLTEAQDRKRN